MSENTTEIDIDDAGSGSRQERVVMCQYIGCKEHATVRIVNANMNCCNDHFVLNTLKFGCAFTTEKVGT